MSEFMGTRISIREAAYWLARMAAKDGVVSANERKLLKEFADQYSLEARSLYRIAHAIADKVAIPEVEPISMSKWKGNKFEEFVVALCSDKSCFKLLSWRSDKIAGKVYAYENLLPDLHLSYTLNGLALEIFIECKFRTSLKDGVLDIGGSIDRYRRAVKEIPEAKLLFAIGIGGTSSEPDEFYLIPDSFVKDEGKIVLEECRHFRCTNSSEAFKDLLNVTIL